MCVEHPCPSNVSLNIVRWDLKKCTRSLRSRSPQTAGAQLFRLILWYFMIKVRRNHFAFGTNSECDVRVVFQVPMPRGSFWRFCQDWALTTDRIEQKIQKWTNHLQTLSGSLSAVSKPILATKIAKLNIHFAAFLEIYKICNDLYIFALLRSFVRQVK